MKYRKKPVEVDAWPVAQIVEQMKHDEEGLPEPVRVAWKRRHLIRALDGLIVATYEGAMEAAPDDWLIRGVEGELYPCKPSVFAATYEAVE